MGISCSLEEVAQSKWGSHDKERGEDEHHDDYRNCSDEASEESSAEDHIDEPQAEESKEE
jgi:hypothetical protein